MRCYVTLIKRLLLGLCCITLLSVCAQATSPLPIEQAFELQASLGDDHTVRLHWQIADNHYLYREKFCFSVISPQGARIGRVILPKGQARIDQFLGKHHVFSHQVIIAVPILNLTNHQTIALLQAHYQGCSASGYCYPPVNQRFQVNVATGKIQRQTAEANLPAPAASPALPDKTTQLLQSHHILAIVFGFLLLGLLLSFTPCVLPMIPIVSSIIVGHQKNITPCKGLMLSLTYVLSMASTYAIAGMAAGYSGISVQAVMQTPWVITSISLLFVLLALAFFGVYRLQLPQKLQDKIQALSSRQKGGGYLSVAIMGVLATLILSPCITPALVGVLSYIAHSGNAALGGSALFFMGLGMGMPLLLIGVAGGKWLPQSGSWMYRINQAFGLLMLAVAIWLLSRILPGQIILALWSLLSIITGVLIGALHFNANTVTTRLQQGVGFVVLLYGIVLLVGASLGNTHPLRPLANRQTASAFSAQQNHPPFLLTQSLPETQALITKAAKEQNKPILLDFYANWCTTCQALDAQLFSQPAVIKALSSFTLIRADITEQNKAQHTLQKHYHVIAPPAMLFFNRQGQLIPEMTLFGYINQKDFLQHLERMTSSKIKNPS